MEKQSPVRLRLSSKSYDSYIGTGPMPISPYAKDSCKSADGVLQSSLSAGDLSQSVEVLTTSSESSLNLIFKVSFVSY